MNYYTLYIYFIFAVKVGFIVMAITHIYLKFKGNEGSDLDKKIEYWKERFEFVFVFLMALLLIYLFNTRHDRSIMIDHETKILLFLFGFVLIITADWGLFFRDSKLLKNVKFIQNIVGTEGKK
jgi:hypothetical protein